MRAKGKTFRDDDRELPARDLEGEYEVRELPHVTQHFIDGELADPATVEVVEE